MRLCQSCGLSAFVLTALDTAGIPEEYPQHEKQVGELYRSISHYSLIPSSNDIHIGKAAQCPIPFAKLRLTVTQKRAASVV